MPSTTVRVDRATHAKFAAIAAASGKPMIEVLRRAADALEQVQFARTVATELDDLRADHDSWAAYVGESESTHVTDGLT